MFRLLTVSETPLPPSTPTLAIASRSIFLRSHPTLPPESAHEPYICISYTWGTATSPNPLEPGFTISSRTLPVLSTALQIHAQSQRPSPIWLDALCVPQDEPQRRRCLTGMSRIYGHARSVLVVLSPTTASALEKPESEINDDDLARLDEDVWVTRAWTYQELTNCEKVGFVAEGSGRVVDGMTMLNRIGTALRDFKNRHGIDHYEDVTARFSRLSSLMDLIVEWFISPMPGTPGDGALCALKAMANMDRRAQTRYEDRYYAMVGVVNRDVDATMLETLVQELKEAREVFMRVCEEKGDFSWVYSTAARGPSRTWRPAGIGNGVDDFRAIIPWHSWGAGQSGEEVMKDRLLLKGVVELRIGEVKPEVLRSMQESFSRSDAASWLEFLRKIGFSGCGRHIETENGRFYPQHEWPEERKDDLILVVASGLKYAWGAPGLLGYGKNPMKCLSSGVFIGILDRPEICDVVLS